MITKGRQGWIISSFKYDFPHSWSLAQTAPPTMLQVKTELYGNLAQNLPV